MQQDGQHYQRANPWGGDEQDLGGIGSQCRSRHGARGRHADAGQGKPVATHVFDEPSDQNVRGGKSWQTQ